MDNTGKYTLFESKQQDACILQACKEHDEKAWECLLATSRMMCRGIAARQHVPPDAFDDLFAEFCVRLLGRPGKPGALERFTGASSLKTYLTVVFCHVVNDYYRQQTRGIRVVETETPIEEHAMPVEASGDEESDVARALRALSQDEAGTLLARGLEHLAPDERKLFELYNYHDLNLRQIAAIMACSEATISRRLAAVRRKLRGVLEMLMSAAGMLEPGG